MARTLVTSLHDHHVALGAKMVPFAGWEMPINYPTGIIAEHTAVREGCGIFDVSHMGRISIEGPDAERFCDSISTNVIAGKADGLAIYTVLPNDQGGSVDDALIYRESATRLFLVANADNRQKDLDHLQTLAHPFDVTLRTHDEGILAIQGPKAPAMVAKLFPLASDLKPMHFARDNGAILCHTGYTGSGGFEIIAPNPQIVELWEKLVGMGATPAGLGARDTLRLEMGFALYGHELSDEIAATESVAAWTVHFDHEFLGRQALLELEDNPRKRSQCGLILQEKGIARAGHRLFHQGREIGHVTSGTHSPSLQQSIAIALVEGTLSEGQEVEIEVRHKRLTAQVTTLPFWRTK